MKNLAYQIVRFTAVIISQPYSIYKVNSHAVELERKENESHLLGLKIVMLKM